IPYLDGGTEPFASAVRAYIPGKTACINCQMGLENMAKEWAKRKMERNSCESEEKEPSVVISNMIAGSILAGEASLMLESGKAAKKSINYDSSADYELYTAFITSPISSCKCNMKDLRKI
ncbi:MAG: hypothetical protein NTV63_02585, partial [Candidatus Woesearchaeota archaeon]|nr:hypothetical protein [Candidatus Woesearchaeota archaeon]